MCPGADVRHDLYNPGPVFYLLESQHEPVTFLLGLLVALMHALSMPSSDPALDVMVWLLCDELSKLVELPAVQRMLFLLAQESRHRKASAFLAGQHLLNLPRGLLGIASGVLQFTPVSAQDAELLRELHHFRGVDLRQLMTMLAARSSPPSAAPATPPSPSAPSGCGCATPSSIPAARP